MWQPPRTLSIKPSLTLTAMIGVATRHSILPQAPRKPICASRYDTAATLIVPFLSLSFFRIPIDLFSLSLYVCVQFCNILLRAIGVDLLARDDSQNTPLHSLVRAAREMEERGDYFDVLQKMVTPQTATARNRHGETPLHIAAMYGNTSVVFLLIRNGASTGAKTWCVFSHVLSLSLARERALCSDSCLGLGCLIF